ARHRQARRRVHADDALPKEWLREVWEDDAHVTGTGDHAATRSRGRGWRHDDPRVRSREELTMGRKRAGQQVQLANCSTTPCGHRITRLNPGWEHHKIEYSHHDLRALLKRFFKRIIEPGQADFPNQAFWDGVINRDRVRYLLR